MAVFSAGVRITASEVVVEGLEFVGMARRCRTSQCVITQLIR